jgi:hypothetical protein
MELVMASINGEGPVIMAGVKLCANSITMLEGG